jgi:single-stranded-DNA-specific exonuclease
LNKQTKRWITKILPSQEKAKTLATALNVNPYVAVLLAQRSIETFEEAKSFFRPSLTELHDPFLMRDMDKAVVRLIQAIKQNERILIYGDYDVDGTTSVSVFYGFLKKYYTNIEYYIPDRYKEGYGVSKAGMEHARDTHVKLIVSLDCGIRSVDMVQLAKSFGITTSSCHIRSQAKKLPLSI